MTLPATVGTHDSPGRLPEPTKNWPKASLLLARPVISMMPWGTIAGGCVAGTALLAVLAYFAGMSHNPLDQTTVKLTLLPAIVALTFASRAPARALTHSAAVPAWIVSGMQNVVALFALALTCSVQLVIMDHSNPSADRHHLAAIYPLIAQVTGWAAIAIVTAACCDRTRYSDLTGAVAAPITLGLVSCAWLTPGVNHLFETGPAAPRTATIAWYTITALLLAVTAAALRDPWYRYKRHPGRPSIQES